MASSQKKIAYIVGASTVTKFYEDTLLDGRPRAGSRVSGVSATYEGRTVELDPEMCERIASSCGFAHYEYPVRDGHIEMRLRKTPDITYPNWRP